MSNARELAELGGAYSTGGYPHFKNRIINGAMMIDQRNAGASVSITTDAKNYVMDRFWAYDSTDGDFSLQQVSVAPSGFINSAKVTITNADASVGSGQYAGFSQLVEGLNCADLAWGTASAATVTLSFWVKSSLTGTFGGSLRNNAADRSYPFSYTISSANTWEQKSITVAGDASGTWLTTNGIGIRVNWSIADGSSRVGTAGTWAAANYGGATGQTQIISTAGATFYITGVQLEKGSTATSFDYRPYGTELALCQRYCIKYGGQQNYEPLGPSLGFAASSGQLNFVFAPPVSMRTQPTLSYSGSWQTSVLNTAISAFAVATNQTTTNSICINATTSGLTIYSCYQAITANNTTASAILSAEL